MNIFGASIHQAADTFLHAGYISASPHEPDVGNSYPMFQDLTDTGLTASLNEALQVAEPETADAAMVWGAGLTESLAGIGPVALGAAAVAGVAWLAMRTPVGRWLPAKATALAPGLAAVVLAGACLAPWHNLEPRDYVNPELANVVVMNSLLRDGLVVYDDEHDSKAMSMAAIQDHVALPVLDPTEGQEYALQAYGWDGWARSFDFAPDNMEYVVTSAGPDGDLDTDDDISATFVRQDTLGHAGTYYLARRDGTLYLATRRHLVGGIEGPAGALADSYDGGELGEWVELPGNEGLYYAIPLTVEFLEDHVWAFDPEYGEAEHSAADAVTAVEALYESHATDDDPDPVVVQIYGVSIES